MNILFTRRFNWIDLIGISLTTACITNGYTILGIVALGVGIAVSIYGERVIGKG